MYLKFTGFSAKNNSPLIAIGYAKLHIVAKIARKDLSIDTFAYFKAFPLRKGISITKLQ